MYLSDISYPCVWVSWLYVLFFNMFLYPGTPIGDVQLYLQALVTLWSGLLVYILDLFKTCLGYLSDFSDPLVLVPFTCFYFLPKLL